MIDKNVTTYLISPLVNYLINHCKYISFQSVLSIIHLISSKLQYSRIHSVMIKYSILLLANMQLLHIYDIYLDLNRSYRQLLARNKENVRKIARMFHQAFKYINVNNYDS